MGHARSRIQISQAAEKHRSGRGAEIACEPSGSHAETGLLTGRSARVCSTVPFARRRLLVSTRPDCSCGQNAQRPFFGNIRPCCPPESFDLGSSITPCQCFLGCRNPCSHRSRRRLLVKRKPNVGSTLGARRAKINDFGKHRSLPNHRLDRLRRHG